MSAIAIRVENLGKRYRIGQREPYKTLRDALAQAAIKPARNLLATLNGHRSHNGNERSKEYIWALKDITFDVKQGEVLGIIGPNGAGKSTLLKILSRITKPTKGYAFVHGRIGSLLEVGTGFHPELTGRENIYLNGAILGMRKAEIDQKFDEVVAFSEVEAFLDTPVKRYSSGMYMRLAFSVAAHLEPETLVVDEVLAVGDAAFQQKCLGKMRDVAKEGRTVLFVSHNMGAVRSLCSRAMLLDQGRIVIEGEPASIITAYLANDAASTETEGQYLFTDESDVPDTKEMQLKAIRLVGADGQMRSSFEVDKPIDVEISYEVKQALGGMRISLWLLTMQGEVAFVSTDSGSKAETLQPGIYKSICQIPGGLLNIARYTVRVDSDIPGVKILHPTRDYISFTTVGKGNQDSFFPENWPGVVCPKLPWRVIQEEGCYGK